MDDAYRAMRERAWKVRVWHTDNGNPLYQWNCDLDTNDGRGWVPMSCCQSRNIALLVAARQKGIITYDAYVKYFNSVNPDDPLVNHDNALSPEVIGVP